MMNALFKTTLCGVLMMALAACADNPYQRTMAGAGLGGATGAGIGYAINKGKGAAIGGAIGALAGGAIGNYMDRQQQALEQSLAQERSQGSLNIVRQPDNSIRLDMPSEVLFDFDSAAIKPSFAPSLGKVANVLQQYPDTNIKVVGYTDSVGSDQYNMGLSQRRAQSVANYLASQGVTSQRLATEGMGKQNPRASNATEAGRQQNRRVEMFIQPVAQQGQPPAQGGYGQAPGGNPPAQGGYGQRPGAYPPPPAQGGYGQRPGAYPPPAQRGYGQTSGGYPPPAQGGYPQTGEQSGGYGSQGGYQQTPGAAAGGYGNSYTPGGY
jgi:outer membrane protein OmpA-like peptidoglycan-associated protein